MGTDILKYVSLCKPLGFLLNLFRTDRYHPHDSLVILFNTKFTKLDSAILLCQIQCLSAVFTRAVDNGQYYNITKRFIPFYKPG